MPEVTGESQASGQRDGTCCSSSPQMGASIWLREGMGWPGEVWRWHCCCEVTQIFLPWCTLDQVGLLCKQGLPRGSFLVTIGTKCLLL